MDDLKIVELYLSRSEDAIAETDLKYGKLCRYVAMNILRNNEDSEECVNDTYFGAWNAIPPQKPNRFSAFISKITRNLALKKYEYVLYDSGVNADGEYINLSVIHSAIRERLEYEAGVLFSIHFTDERRPMDYIWPWPGFTIAVTETGSFHLVYPSDVQFDESDPASRAEYEELSADIKNIKIIMSTEMLENTMNASNWIQGTMFIDFLEDWQVVKSVVCDVEQSQIIRSIIESQAYGEPGSFQVDLRFMVDKDEYFMNSITGEIMVAAGGNSAVVPAEDLSRIMDLLSD